MDALVEKMVEDMRARGVALEIIERSAGQLEAFVAHNRMTPLARRSAADVRSYQVRLLVDERWSSKASVKRLSGAAQGRSSTRIPQSGQLTRRGT